MTRASEGSTLGWRLARKGKAPDIYILGTIIGGDSNVDFKIPASLN